MTITPSLDAMQDAGFPIGGEPLVALDLVDTQMLAVEPHVDLLDPARQAEAWWQLQAGRLPGGPLPDEAATYRLRDSIRDVFQSYLDGRSPRPSSIEDVNSAASAAPTSPRLDVGADGMRTDIRWHVEHGGNARLAAIAREVIGLMGSPELREQLRRCANPECSMLFLAQNPRRQWCASNVCGNRARVARHYQRRKSSQPGS